MKRGDIMAISEAQKRASNKYNSKHMTTLGCKVKKEDAEKFKTYASTQNKTSNALLKEYVLNCIKNETMEKDNSN